jgi:putative tryptophan/tyrosine transport system substrate-binding protein
MHRRAFLSAVGTSLLAVPARVLAQASQPIPRVGYLFSFTPAEGRHLWEACRRGLRDLGYVEGRTIFLEPRWTDGHYERLPQLAAELVRLKPDVVVTAATPGSRAMKAATSTIPIVIVAVAEPVKAELVASLARPGSNVTGLSLLTPELSAKRLELVVDVLQNVPRVALLMNPDNGSHAVFLDETRRAAQRLSIPLHSLEARNPDEIERAFETATGLKAAALIVFDDPVIWSHRARIVELAAKRRVPVIYGYREFVDGGGLISYGPDRIEMYRRTAVYVDKILKGAKPADLPIEQPTKFELVVNVKTAKTLGLVIPRTLLLRAEHVIE